MNMGNVGIVSKVISPITDRPRQVFLNLKDTRAAVIIKSK